jgi:predicted Zn finger-like uncharacterized protein
MLEKEGPETPLLDRSNAFFKCPYCGTKYEMTTAHLSFKQRSYAKCQVCNQTIQLEFPKRAYLHTHECVQGRDARHRTLTRVRD